MSCVFCQIVAKDIPSDLLYEDDEIIAFRDIAPMAPVHILIVSKQHISAITDLADDDNMLIIGKMAHVATKLAEKEGIAEIEKGFRIAVNYGDEGGQTVGHLHMHMLGGRKLSGLLG